MHRLTKPLKGNEGPDGLPIESDGYNLILLVEIYWLNKGKPLRLDTWQKHLLIRILERCPEGHPRAGALRYRQVVVSIPRQAGKSLLAAILSLYGLLQHTEAPTVLGVARGAEQAKIVYRYTYNAIASSDVLSGLFRQTETRGISKTDGIGSYKVLPAKPEAIQGYESTFAICDELHVMKPDIWDAIVTSQRAQEDPLLVGITTAGDITSTLLKRLYEQGDKAIAGGQETFGFFVYESSSTELTLEAITEANPAVACGRISAETILNDEQHSPPSNWRRFALNVFVEGLAEPWVPVESWARCAGTGLEDFSDAIYGIDITPTHSYATIYAAKVIDGVVQTALVARLVKPSQEKLQSWVLRIRDKGRCTFILDPNRLRTLTEFLDNRGQSWAPMRIFGGRKQEAAGTVYRAVMSEQVQHDNNALVNNQHATARTKSAGTDGFVIVPNAHDADATYASVYAIYGALTKRDRSTGIA